MGAAILLGSTLPKDEIVAPEAGAKREVFRSAIAHINTSGELQELLVAAVLVVGIAEVSIEYIALYYDQLGAATRYVPLLLGLGATIGALLFWTLHKWEKFLDDHKSWFMVAGIVIFVGSFYGNFAVAVGGMILFTRLIRVLQVQFDANLQQIANEESRATISSIGSFGAKILAAAIALAMGFFSVDDSIVRPLRIAFVLGGLAFLAVEAGRNQSKYRQKQIDKQ